MNNSFPLQNRCRWNSGSSIGRGKIRADLRSSVPGFGAGIGPGVLNFRVQARRRDEETEEFDDYIDPAKAEPLEAIDPADEELTKFDRVVREAEKVRKSQEEEYKRTEPVLGQ